MFKFFIMSSITRFFSRIVKEVVYFFKREHFLKTIWKRECISNEGQYKQDRPKTYKKNNNNWFSKWLNPTQNYVSALQVYNWIILLLQLMGVKKLKKSYYISVTGSVKKKIMETPFPYIFLHPLQQQKGYSVLFLHLLQQQRKGDYVIFNRTDLCFLWKSYTTDIKFPLDISKRQCNNRIWK